MLKIFCRWILALFFVAAGALHFAAPETYREMIPPSFPWPVGLVAISGAAEILGGIGLMISSWRRLAGWGLIALLIAVFPANLHAALVGHMPGWHVSPVWLWLRLPLQGVFAAAVWWIARADSPG